MRMGLSQHGATLVELIVVVVILGAVAAGAGAFVTGPVQSFVDQSRRAALADSADVALRQMSRDIRAALPNSVRVSGNALELLRTVDGDRYRAEPPGDPATRLVFSAPDDQFNVLGPLGGAGTFSGHHLAIYPLGQPGANPYLDSVMTPVGTVITVSGVTGPTGSGTEYRVSLSAAHQFPFDSPGRRVFLVDSAVSYVCENGELRRYSGYNFGATQPTTAADFAPDDGALVTNQVASCSWTYQTLDTAQRDGLATLAVVLESKGEQVRLMRQLHVDNVP